MGEREVLQSAKKGEVIKVTGVYEGARELKDEEQEGIKGCKGVGLLQ